jgi:hypothetical protein
MPDVSISDENYKPLKQEIILNYAQLDCKQCIQWQTTGYINAYFQNSYVFTVQAKVYFSLRLQGKCGLTCVDFHHI